MNTILKLTRDNLVKRGYKVYLCENKDNLLDTIYQNILPQDISGMVIGLGHSETLEEINLLAELQNRKAMVYYHKPPLTSADDDRKALLADAYFLSANAISQDDTS